MGRKLSGKILHSIDWIVDRMDDIARMFLLVLVFWVFLNIILRYFFKAPIAISMDIAMIINVLLVYLPLAAAMKGGNHPAITTLPERLNLRPRAILQTANFFLTALAGCIVTFLLWKDMLQLLEYHVTLDTIPGLLVGLIRIPMIIGMIVFIFLAIAQGGLTIRNLVKGNPFEARPNLKID